MLCTLYFAQFVISIYHTHIPMYTVVLLICYNNKGAFMRIMPKAFLQHVSIACYAQRCISYDRFCLSDRLTVCHTLVSCQNDSSYTIIRSSLEDSPMALVSSRLTSPRNCQENMGSEGAE